MKHTFSVELESKEFLKTMSVSESHHQTVYFEGFLGDIEDINILSGGLLEVKGVNGILRLDLSEEDLKSLQFGKHDIKKKG
jgi:hypothetical protein